MAFDSKIPSKFNPYYRSNILLIQFMLFELISLFLESKKHRGSSILTILSAKGGHLDKLRGFAEEYLKNLNKIHDSDKSFYFIVQSAWSTACLGLDPYQPQPIKKLLHSLRNQLDEINSQFTTLLLQYRKNENVILFILKNRVIIDRIFGAYFIESFLESSTTKDKDLLCKLLSRQYSKRGFDHLLPAIHQQVFSGHASK